MGSDAESDPYNVPKLPLFSMVSHLSEPSGMLTPPLQTAASVPFRWEEQPGKPRIIASTDPKTRTDRCLELPPRLAMVESYIITKTSSPTTVLDGPGSKSIFSSSSFRFSKERRRRGQMQGSFDSTGSDGWSPNDDVCGGQQLVLLDNKIDRRNGDRSHRRFGSFRRAKDGMVISPAADAGFFDEKKGDETMGRNSSLSKVTRSHFWATIYESLKQAAPWKKKSKKENFTI
ncbi:hypothetical protein R6Q57_015440 [Mikania cordata]